MKRHTKWMFLFLIIWLLSPGYFSLAIEVDFRCDSHGRRDPFISIESAWKGGVSGQGDFTLEGVILDPKGESFAIVNSEIVKEGDQFEGFQLVKVEANRAVFRQDGEDFEVLLRQDDEDFLKQYSKNARPS